MRYGTGAAANTTSSTSGNINDVSQLRQGSSVGPMPSENDQVNGAMFAPRVIPEDVARNHLGVFLTAGHLHQKTAPPSLAELTDETAHAYINSFIANDISLRDAKPLYLIFRAIQAGKTKLTLNVRAWLLHTVLTLDLSKVHQQLLLNAIRVYIPVQSLKLNEQSCDFNKEDAAIKEVIDKTCNAPGLNDLYKLMSTTKLIAMDSENVRVNKTTVKGIIAIVCISASYLWVMMFGFKPYPIEYLYSDMLKAGYGCDNQQQGLERYNLLDFFSRSQLDALCMKKCVPAYIDGCEVSVENEVYGKISFAWPCVFILCSVFFSTATIASLLVFLNGLLTDRGISCFRNTANSDGITYVSSNISSIFRNEYVVQSNQADDEAPLLDYDAGDDVEIRAH